MSQTHNLPLLLGEELICNGSEAGEFKTLKTSSVLGPDAIVGLYFSAHWCPPCRRFTPKLVEAYKKLRAAGHDFQIIFISSDHGESYFKDYFAEMPWLAVPYQDTNRRHAAKNRMGVMGIPSLIILTPDGEIITKEGRMAVEADPEGANYPWEGYQASGNLGLWLYRTLTKR